MKGFFYLCFSAGKFYDAAPTRNAIDLEAVRLEPSIDRLHVLISGAELGSELVGS